MVTLIKERRCLGSLLLIVILACLIYLNSLNNDFVFDDNTYIVKNAYLKDLRNLPKFFTNKYAVSGANVEAGFKPLRLLSLAIDYRLWGLNPFYYRLINLVIFTLNGILVYFLLNLIFSKVRFSLYTALLFISHPIQTEILGRVSSRDDLLCVFFSLLCLLLFIKTTYFSVYPSFTRRCLQAASILSLALALLSKETALILPLLIILYDGCFGIRYKKGKLIPFILLLVILTGYLWARETVLRNNPIRNPYWGGSLYATVLTMCKVLVYYFKLLLWPVRLSAMPWVSISTSLWEPRVLFSLGVLFSLLIVILKIYRRSKIAFFAIMWFLICLIPSSNLIPLRVLLAERWLYLSSLGFCMLLALLIEKSQRLLRNIALVLFLLILGLYSLRVIYRNRDWKDEFSLWSRTAQEFPDNFKAHAYLGNIYHSQARLDLAIKEFQAAIRLSPQPGYSLAHNNLGLVYFEQGRYTEAEAEFKKAIEIKSDVDYFHAYVNLGMVYQKKGLMEEAIRDYKMAIELNPHLIAGHINLGNIYLEKGFLIEAINEYKQAIDIYPYDAVVHYNLGIAYDKKGELDFAIEEYKQAITLEPKYSQAYNNLGIVYHKKGFLLEAKQQWEEALRLDPHNRSAKENLNLVLP